MKIHNTKQDKNITKQDKNIKPNVVNHMWNLVGKTGFLMIMQSRLPSNDLTTAKESIVKTEEKVLWFTFKAGGYYLDSST